MAQDTSAQDASAQDSVGTPSAPSAVPDAVLLTSAAPVVSTLTPAPASPATSAAAAAATNRPLSGRVALVTGSSTKKGIGYGIACALAEQGASIMLNGLGDAAVIEEIRSHIESDFGVRAIYHPANLSNRSDIADLVATTVSQLGGLDILVNNAGVQHVAPIVDFPEDKYRAIMSINLDSAWYLCKDALPHMKTWGRIINVASAHGLVGSARKSAYVMSKHGLVGMTKSLALEYAKTTVRINALCPGWVYTDLVIDQIKKRQTEKGLATFQEAEADLLSEKEPTVQFTTIEELGGIAVFLCGGAARNITGTTISCDGAWTAE
jgi:3-hydroxybutyrate dehydrogenase